MGRKSQKTKKNKNAAKTRLKRPDVTEVSWGYHGTHLANSVPMVSCGHRALQTITADDDSILKDPAQKTVVQLVEKSDSTHFRMTMARVNKDMDWSKATDETDIYAQRFDWSPPYLFALEQPTGNPKINMDSRGLLSDIKSVHAKFRNMYGQDIRIVCSSPRADPFTPRAVTFRDYQRDLVIQPGQTIGVTMGWGSTAGFKVPLVDYVKGAYDPAAADKKKSWPFYGLLDFAVIVPEIDIFSNTHTDKGMEIVEVELTVNYTVNMVRSRSVAIIDREPFVLSPLKTFEDCMSTTAKLVKNPATSSLGASAPRANVPIWISGKKEQKEQFLVARLAKEGIVNSILYLCLYDGKGEKLRNFSLEQYEDRRFGVVVPSFNLDNSWGGSTVFRYDRTLNGWFLWDEQKDVKIVKSLGNTEFDDCRDATGLEENWADANQALLLYDREYSGFLESQGLDIDFDTIVAVLFATIKIVRIVASVAAIF